MHSCPECGQACFCNGDIDDLMWGDDSDEAMNCSHVCGPEDAELDLDDLGMPGYEDYTNPHVVTALDEGPRCQACGCTQLNACPSGCVWATPTLCSRCVG